MAEAWYEKLRRMRHARGWSLHDAAQHLVAAADQYTPDQVESARKAIQRWERGDVKDPGASYKRPIARMFDLPVGDFWPAPRSEPTVPARLASDEFAELIQALAMPRVGDGELAVAEAQVERLCSDYASVPAAKLLPEVTDWLRRLEQLVTAGRVSYSGHQRVLRLTGWLALLRSCLLWDERDEPGAQQARAAALAISEEIGDGPMGAWAWEIQSWIALTKGDLPLTIAMARRGIDLAPTAPVAAQLYAQQAKAHARMADRHKTETALDHIRTVLDANPEPTNVRNHFAVDPTKASFYMMDSYRVLEVNNLADTLAESIVIASTAPDGSINSPMRLSEAQLTRAIVLARRGDTDSALTLAAQALTYPRKSTPSLLMIASEVGREVSRTEPAAAAEFLRHVEALRADRT